VLAAMRPLALTTWAGRTGLGELRGPGALDRERRPGRVRVDLSLARRYALAVRAATDAYLCGVAEDDLGRHEAEALTAVLLDLAARRGEIGGLLSG
jgi:hypothetical protein